MKKERELTKGGMAALRQENATLRAICVDLAWMARRYATGRMSYAPSAYNEHARKLLELGVKLNPTAEGTIWAEDGGGRQFDGLDEEQLIPHSPGATGQYIPLPHGCKLHELIADALGTENAAEAARRILAWKKDSERLAKLEGRGD